MTLSYFLRLLCCLSGAAVVLTGCYNDLPLPGESAERQIALLGELSAGDTVAIRAGQSTPLSSSGTGTQLIQGLSLSLKDETGATTDLQAGEDYLMYMLFTLPYSSPQRIAPGRTYQLRGAHPQLKGVVADVRVPTPFTATLRAMAATTYNDDSVLSIDIELRDPAGAGAFYVIEAVKQPMSIEGYFYFDGNEYSIDDDRRLFDSLKAEHVIVSERYDTSYSGLFVRQPIYTTDPGTEGFTAGRMSRRVFLPGKSLSGATHHTRVMVPSVALYGEPGQQAQTLIYVKSVSADYYEFLKAYEQYDPTMGLGGNAAPARVKGNVQGGLGMVGGVYKWSVSVIY